MTKNSILASVTDTTWNRWNRDENLFQERFLRTYREAKDIAGSGSGSASDNEDNEDDGGEEEERSFICNVVTSIVILLILLSSVLLSVFRWPHSPNLGPPQSNGYFLK